MHYLSELTPSLWAVLSLSAPFYRRGQRRRKPLKSARLPQPEVMKRSLSQAAVPQGRLFTSSGDTAPCRDLVGENVPILFLDRGLSHSRAVSWPTERVHPDGCAAVPMFFCYKSFHNIHACVCVHTVECFSRTVWWAGFERRPQDSSPRVILI